MNFFAPTTLEEKGGNILEKSNKPVKKRTHVPNPNGSPLVGDRGLIVEDGDNRKYLMVSMQIMNLPEINLNDAVQVAERLEEYFKIYMNQTMTTC